MATEIQIKKFEKALRNYRKEYLAHKKYDEQNESGTRILVNDFLIKVLGYSFGDNITTEQAIKGGYADYGIKIGRKNYFVIEVKSIGIDLNERHLKQARQYAADEGIDWIILTNGKCIKLYRLLFLKPVKTQLIFDCDLSDLSKIKNTSKNLILLSKQSINKNELEKYYQKFNALVPENLIKIIQSDQVIKSIKKELKNKTGVMFNEIEIKNGVKETIK
jgi:predicted type IV restriction endonuclease